MKLLQISFWVLLTGIPIGACAQNTITEDSIRIEHQNRSRKKRNRRMPDPSKAFLYSIIFPSAGQIYNQKYWKAPIVLGGIAGGIILINFHQTQYYTAKQELYSLLRDNSYIPPSGRTESQLRGQIDRSQRDRDLFSMLTILWYFLQAIEAHTDAHLYFFSVNPKLKISLEPVIENNFSICSAPGLALKFRF